MKGLKMKMKFRRKTSKAVWGFFWLLIAGLVLANYFGGFVELSVWSIIIGAVALIILCHCIASLSIASMPIPLGALYYIFQDPLDLPFIPFWTLALVAVLLTCGLHVLLPKRLGSRQFVNININEGKKSIFGSVNKAKKDNANIYVNGSEIAGEIIDDLEADGIEIDIDEDYDKTKVEEGDDPNNPYISVSFGAACRYLHADRLETADLRCNFGSLEVYFDNVTLHPDGAEVNITSSFGSVEVYIPSHWRVIDDIGVSLGNAEVSGRLQRNDPSSPTLKVTGSVSLGNAEVKRIKGD